MRFIHTADWHIGKALGEIVLLEDQQDYLLRLCDYAGENGVDAFLIAGDLYHRAIPPAEAVVLFDEVLDRLINRWKIPVLAIAGNHDSPERIGFGSRLYQDRGLYIEGIVKPEIRRVTLEDAHGGVDFHLLPYVEPAKIRALLGDKEIRTFNSAYEALLNMEGNRPDRSRRNVILAHGFFGKTGKNDKAVFSESERNIGGSDFVDSGLLAEYDYVALGHLHAPQCAGEDHIRYSGSILKYSLSEVDQKKAALLVDLDRDGRVEVQEIVLPPKRDLRILEGHLEELVRGEDPCREDYVFARLADDMVYDAMGKLRVAYPNAIGLDMASTRRQQELFFQGAEKVARKSLTELFQEFHKAVSGDEMKAEHRDVLAELIHTVETGEVER